MLHKTFKIVLLVYISAADSFTHTLSLHTENPFPHTILVRIPETILKAVTMYDKTVKCLNQSYVSKLLGQCNTNYVPSIIYLSPAASATPNNVNEISFSYQFKVSYLL